MNLLFQCGETNSDPWAGAKEFWNYGLENSSFNFWNKIGESKSIINYYEKKKDAIIFDRLPQDNNNFYLVKPFFDESENLWKDYSKKIDVDFIVDWLKKNKNCSLGFGYFFPTDRWQDEIDIMKGSIFYTRKPSFGGHIFDVQNNIFLTDENKNKLDSVTFFYVYKMLEHDTYFFIMNPNLITLSRRLEFKEENYNCRTMSPNCENFSELILKPKFSETMGKLKENWYYTHKNSFIFEPGKLSVIYDDIEDVFDRIKITSDLKIDKIDKNKYQATFKEGQNISFLSLRVNTSSLLDWTLSNSQNRLIYNIIIQKFYKNKEE
jgi:hypothetical protein